MVEFQVLDLGRDYHGKITDFASARNHLLLNAATEWVLFVDSDEEAPQMLLEYVKRLKPQYPYYWVRRANLFDGIWQPLWNPEFAPRLVSKKVRFHGRVHERVVPKNPHGIIDIPLIHNHHGPSTYQETLRHKLPFYRLILTAKKVSEVARGR